MIDSHCHLNRLDLTPYDNQMEKLIQAAKDAGIKAMMNISIDLETAPEVVAVAEQFEHVYASVGLHPSDVKGQCPSKAELLKLLDHPKVIAVGETGLDYHYNADHLDAMRESFRMHIAAAKETGKPLVIHTRAAQEDTLSIMREEKAGEIGGVMHCFTESLEMAQASLALGFYISISGIVTFKNATNVQEIVKEVPLEKLLIETDAPYLTPVPYRGKANYPQYVHYVAEKIAELKGLRYQDVIDQTTENFYQCFRSALLRK